MIKILFALLALLGLAFAAPKPDPLTLTYPAGSPLGLSPISYSNLGYYGISPYASTYYGNYGYPLPIAYRDLYI